MTEAQQFRQYADEARYCANEATDPQEALRFIGLYMTWSAAARMEELLALPDSVGGRVTTEPQAGLPAIDTVTESMSAGTG